MVRKALDLQYEIDQNIATTKNSHTYGTGYTLLGQNYLTPGFHYIIDEEYKIQSLWLLVLSQSYSIYSATRIPKEIRKETLKN